MTIDRRDWRAAFGRFPSWRCPTCQRGTLTERSDTKHVIETGPSKDGRTYGGNDIDDIVERFVCLLDCSNPECREVVSASGVAGHEEEYDEQLMEMTYQRYYKPQFFVPALPLFTISSKCPEPVAAEIRKAAALYWSDTGSCANRLRSAVEALLTDRKVARSTLNKKHRRVPLSLHSRIDKFKTIDAENADMLLAIKWLGNAGSHANLDALTTSDLLDGFELFEHVVERIYANRDKAMKRLAKGITNRKGKPKKAKRGSR